MLKIADYLNLYYLGEKLNKIWKISFYRNSLYLIITSLISALVGFTFWAIAARLYSTQEVGLASSIIAIMPIIAVLTTFGLDIGIIRFLPNSGDNAKIIINSTFTITIIMSIILTVIFVIGISLWSPDLLFLRQSAIYFILFMIFITATSISLEVDNIFISNRRSGLTMARSFIFHLIKLIMLIALFEIFKSYGIVNAWGIGLLVSLIIGVSIFIPKIYHGYLFKPVFYWKEMKEIIRYSIPNSIYVFLWQITGRILPLLILQLIGAEDSAYFYIAWTIATTISLIPWSISGALFAESSNDDKNLKPQLIRSLMLVLLILIPIIIIVIIIGSQILSIFGANYAIYSSNLLKIWTLSLLPSSINQIFITNLRIKNKLKIIFMIGVFISGFAILTSLFLLPRIGIIGAGISWLTCQSIVAIWVLTKYGWGRILMKQILLTFNRKILPIE